jgi:hypothetical protein
MRCPRCGTRLAPEATRCPRCNEPAPPGAGRDTRWETAVVRHRRLPGLFDAAYRLEAVAHGPRGTYA